ncbi:MAG: LysR family transcriptional regulator [Xanthobacteraceae bacterium]|nr:LysR family transcriptional regulator [Xanthobacteraceae bacterium]
MADTFLNMKAFLSAAEAGSFSRAARQLGVAPSVVTKRVAQLEWVLRAPLFKRTTRSLRLTELGESQLAPIRQIVRDYEEVVTGVMRAPHTLEGHLRIKAPVATIGFDLAKMFVWFQREYPGLTLDVVVVDRTVNPIEEGFDVVMTLMPASFEGVLEEPLFVYERVLCAAPSYLARRGTPKHPRELINHDCIVFPTGPTWTFHGNKGVVEVKVRPQLMTNNGRLGVESLCAGQGIAIISRTVAASALETGELTIILPSFRVPDLWLKALVPAARMGLARVQAFLNHVRAALPTPVS